MRLVTEALANKFDLTPEERKEMLPSGGQTLFSNRVAWAKTHLKAAGLLLNPSRGKVRLSEEGRKVLAATPAAINCRFLRQYPSYLDLVGRSRSEDEDNTAASADTTESDQTPLELMDESFHALRRATADELLMKLKDCSASFFEKVVVKLYRVITRTPDVPGIEWCAGTVEMDAEKLNPKPSGVSREHEEQRSEAVDALRELLEAGAMGATDVQTAMDGQGYSRRMVSHACKVLNVVKSPRHDERGRRSGWVWALPGEAMLEATSGDLRQAGTYSLDDWGRD